MSDREIIKLLSTSESIEALGFYESNCGATRTNPNKGPALCCRIWDLGMSDTEIVAFAKELNEAIAPVTQRWALERRNEARLRLFTLDRKPKGE